MSKEKFYVPLIAMMTAASLVALATVAVADDVVNNVDASVDATYETLSLEAGGASQTVDLYTVNRNDDGKNGCNLTGSTTLVLNVSSNDTSAATVSPSQITFTACEAVGANSATAVTVTPVATGSADIEFSLVSNSSSGTFNLDTARFTVNVTPPPNTPPSVSVTGVTGGLSYEFGAVPAGGCSVTDTEDGNSTFPASLSAITGPLSAYGLGSQTATCSYTDAGSLTATATAAYTIVDATKPALTLPGNFTEEATSASGATATFLVTATDAVDPAPVVSCSAVSGALFPIGTTTVNCSATDVAGNIKTGSFDVTVQDTTDPVVTISTTAVMGAKGWYNIDSSGTGGIIATVTASDAVGVTSLACDDGGTPIVGVSASGDTFWLTDGDHNVTCTAYDAQGNDGSDTENFKVDQTSPTITPSYSAAANGDGWNNTAVTVSYACDDATSGIDPAYGCPVDDVLTANGLYVLHRSTADNAGNVVTPSFTVKIDKDAPTITGSASPAANINGWNNTDVSVSFTCLDLGPSGIKSCTGSSTLGEGTNQSVPGTAVDNADNSTGTTVGPINIDKTAPAISVASRTPANADGWNNGPVTVEFACTDDLSGVDSLTAPVTIAVEGISSVTGTCTDKAGNSASVTVSDIQIDTTKPTITGGRTPAANSNGWNNANVTVSFTCVDNSGGSGIKTDTVAGETLSGEGSGQSVTNTGVCVDYAGNAGDAATVGGIKIDKSGPTAITFVGGGLSNGGSYYFGFVPAGPTSCTADGAISGLDSCSLDDGYSSAVGSHTIMATAVDKAGNQSMVTLSYTVNAWTLRGFYQPVDMPTLTTPYLYNSVKGGSTVPLKFEIFAGSTELTDVAYVTPITTAQVACEAGAYIDEIETTATGATVLRYDATGGQFIYNWQTPKKPGNCYRVTMTTVDGSALVAYFKLK